MFRNSPLARRAAVVVLTVVALAGCGKGGAAPAAGNGTAAAAASSGAAQVADAAKELKNDPATKDFETKIVKCDPLKSNGGAKLFALTKSQLGYTQLVWFKAILIDLKSGTNRDAFYGCAQKQLDFTDQQSSDFKTCVVKAVAAEDIKHPLLSGLDMLEIQLPTCYKKVAKIAATPSPSGSGKASTKPAPSASPTKP
jgi:hypothetical protein